MSARHLRLTGIGLPVRAELRLKSLLEVVDAKTIDLRLEAGAETFSSPSVPRADLPRGMIWPPVQGRLILHEATLQAPTIRQEANGDWCSVDSKGWWIQSPAHAQFRDLSSARAAMLEWARAHSAHSASLGGRRCIALSEEGADSYRLWQCVSRSPTLRDQIEHALSRDAATVVESVMAAIRALVRARTQWQDAGALPVRIEKVTWTPQGPRYVHLMPYPCVADEGGAKEDVLTFLRGEFACVRDRLSTLHHELAEAVVLRAERMSRVAAKPDATASLLNLLLRV